MIAKKKTLLTALFITILSLVCIVLSVQSANADTLIDSGSCGDNLSWELTDTGTDIILIIRGAGEMYDYDLESATPPWFTQRESITNVIVEENVTSIGAHAFDGCIMLSKAEIPNSVVVIDETSFTSCDSLYIYCSEDSYAELYAVDNNMPYDLTIGHQPDTSTVYIEKEATCTENGIRRYVCKTCQREVEETLPASHKWSDDYIVDKPATYDEEGQESIHCSECGAIKEDSTRVIPKLVKRSISKATVSGIVSKTYTGKAIIQAPKVIINDNTLINGTDYSLSYKNNKNVGKATVTITGIGAYKGSISKTFSISKKKITPTIILSKNWFAWNNKVQTPTVTVKDGNTKLAKTQYTITYAKGRKNIGTYSVKVTLKGNYSGSKTATYTIRPKGTSISSLKSTFNKIAVSWGRQTGKMPSVRIAGYQIQYSTRQDFKSGRKTITIGGYNNNTKTIAGLKAEQNYYFRIRTYIKTSGKNYYSGWSAIKGVKTKVSPKLSKDSINLVIGKTYVQKLIDANGNVIKATAVTWKSNAPNIASINKNGKITSIREGSVVMTAKYKGGTFKFTVKSKPPFDSSVKPVITETKQKGSRFTIKWNAIKFADAYDVYVSENGGKYECWYYDVKNNYYSLYATEGVKYSIKIRGNYYRAIGDYKTYFTGFSKPVSFTYEISIDDRFNALHEYIIKNGKEKKYADGITGDYYIESRSYPSSRESRIIISTFVDSNVFYLKRVDDDDKSFTIILNDSDKEDGIVYFSIFYSGLYSTNYWGDMYTNKYTAKLYGEEEGIANCMMSGPKEVTSETDLYKIYRTASDSIPEIDAYLKKIMKFGLHEVGFSKL